MSFLTAPGLVDDRAARALSDLCTYYGHGAVRCYLDVNGVPTCDFEEPLTTAEQTVFADLVLMAQLGLQTMDLATFRARKTDVANLKAFLALPSPTQAQSLAAIQALIRVVGAMLRL